MKTLLFDFPRSFRLPSEFDNLNNQMSDSFGDWIQELSSKSISSVGLSNDKSTDSEYWPRLSTHWIDWSWSLTDIELFCRALLSLPWCANVLWKN